MSDPVTEPTPEEPSAAPVCAYPLLAVYTSQRQARVVACIGSRLQHPWECPTGHWHVLRRTSGDEVPAPSPAPTDPPEAPTAPPVVTPDAQAAPTEPPAAPTSRRPMQRRRR